MIKAARVLTAAAFVAALAGTTAFAQSADAMKKDDHMSSGSMTAMKKDDHMASGAMTAKKDKMASGAMAPKKKAIKKDDHMTSGAMTSGAMSSAPKQ